MRTNKLLLWFALPVAVLAVSAMTQQAEPIGDQIIGMVKAQWAGDIKEPMNATANMKDLADDYTEFNADYATRLEGKSMNVRLGEASGGSTVRTIASEMANPKVQVYNGDVAILSYNYAGVTKDKDGKTEAARAKSTRVYVKQGTRWVLVHANFGADPLPR